MSRSASSILSSKHRAASLCFLLLLSACGFSPLYGQPGADVAIQLDQVQVANIPERNGQMLRQSLETQFQAAGAPTVQRYVLQVNYSINVAGIGIQTDTSVTRNRFIATASWTLAPVGTPATPLTTGFASTENAANVIDQQYFALTLETTTIDQQLADTIAAQISTQVAAYFKTHQA